MSKHCDDQACVTGDRCQWLFVSHAEVAHVQMMVVSGNTDGQPPFNGFLFPNSRTLQPLSSEGSNTCCTSSMAKFSAEIAFDQSARISSVPNRFAVNDATSSALSASGEGAHASITPGTVLRIMWEGFGD